MGTENWNQKIKKERSRLQRKSNIQNLNENARVNIPKSVKLNVLKNLNPYSIFD